MGFREYSRKQQLTVGLFVAVHFCLAVCASMQAPFFPREASLKGLEVWQFGLVFGVFELTVLLISPTIGSNLLKLGVKRTLNVGVGLVGVVLILYGCLGMLASKTLFFTFSILLRVLEACGTSAFLTGSFSAVAREFPTSVASMFALIELFFGMGEIVGPLFGGALYQLGGYMLPFGVMGVVLVVAAISLAVVLPDTPPTQDISRGEKPSVKKALSKPGILIALFQVCTSAASLGFLQATLEPHIHHIHIHLPELHRHREEVLSSIKVGAFFMVIGATYALSLPVWGLLCDSKKSNNSPKFVELIGAFLIATGFLILGPAPFMPFLKSKGSILTGMAFHGLGLGASVVGAFSDAHRSAISCGFSDDIDTFGLVSGLWTSVFALGAFLGPTVGGILYDTITFNLAIFYIVGMQMVSMFLIIGYLITAPKQAKNSIIPTAPTEEQDGVSDNSFNTPTTRYGLSDIFTNSPREVNMFTTKSMGSYMASSLARSMAWPEAVSSGFDWDGKPSRPAEPCMRGQEETESLLP